MAEIDRKLYVDIPLAVPAAEGSGEDAKTHDKLRMRRPRTRHVKQLMVLLGQDFVRNLMKDADMGAAMPAANAAGAEIGGRDMVIEALALLVDESRLDGLSAILADLCNVGPEVVDDLDPVDLMAVGKALFDFFPALASIGSSSS